MSISLTCRGTDIGNHLQLGTQAVNIGIGEAGAPEREVGRQIQETQYFITIPLEINVESGEGIVSE